MLHIRKHRGFHSWRFVKNEDWTPLFSAIVNIECPNIPFFLSSNWTKISFA